MSSKGQKDEKSIDLKIWSVQCPNSFSASTPSFGGVPEFGWKKWDPKLYGKDTFFWLRHKPPNFATFLCAVMWHQNSSKSCRYQMMWWWVTRQNKTQKHNLNTKKQQWKTVLHHHPIWIQKNVTSSKNHILQKKKTASPSSPLLCLTRKFSPQAKTPGQILQLPGHHEKSAQASRVPR